MTRLLAGVLLALASHVSYAATNSGITYQGRILKPDGAPLEGSNVQFKLQVRTPGAENCLLFEELQALDMRNSSGQFSLTMNDGTGTRTDTSGFSIDRVFANRLKYDFSGTACDSGAEYTPNIADGRRLQVFFKDETMSSWEPMPAQNINFVPMAIESKQVQGFNARSLLRVQDADGTLGNFSPLSNDEYDELLALIGGTSTKFSKANELNGKTLPSLAAGQVLGWDGSNWTAVNAATGSATSTTLKDPDGSTSAGVTFQVDPAIAANYTITWPATAGGSGQVLSSNGSGVLSWVTPLTSTTGFVQGGNAFGTAANLGTTDTQPLNLVTGGTSKVTVTPTGLVGIGTTNPFGKLHSHSSDTANQMWILNDSSTAARNPSLVISNFDGTGFGGYPLLSFRANRSDLAGGAAQKSLTGDVLGQIEFGANRGGVTTKPATMRAIATEDQSSTGNGGAITFNTTANGTTALTERMRIDHSGNVGIGTTTPTSPLEVNGNARAAGLIVTNGAQLFSNGTGLNVNLSAGGDFAVANTSASPLLTVKQSGNVGIGTTNPNAMLDVAGVTGNPAGRFNTGAAGTTALLVQQRQNSNANESVLTLDRYHSDGSAAQAGLSGNINMRLQGTTASADAAQMLWGWELNQTNNTTDRDSYIALSTSKDGTIAEKVRISSAGNVGIGTIAPNYKLHVVDSTATPGGSNFAIFNDYTVAPSGTASGNYWGQKNQLNFTGAGNLTGQVLAAEFAASRNDPAAGTANLVSGVAGVGRNDAAGTTTNAYGVIGYTRASDGTITNGYGGKFEIASSGGTTTNGTGVLIGNIQATNKFALYSQDATAPSYFAGKVGLGITAPSASLHLKAGTTAAGTAPLKFTAAPANSLTTPEDGAMEYDGSNLMFTVGSTRKTISLGGSSGNLDNVSAISNSSGNISITPQSGGSVSVGGGTASTTTTTGALTVNGGVGITGAINAGGNITSGGTVISNGVSSTGVMGVVPAGNAVSGTNYDSPAMAFQAKYWDGTASALDYWSIKNMLGTGTTPTSTLTFDHPAGTTGAKSYAFLNGNVGIGTSTPSALFNVVGDGAAIRLTPSTDDIVGTVAVEMSHKKTIIKNAIVSNKTTWGKGDLHFVVNTTNDANSYILANDSRMMISSTTGNVGIGNTNPASPLSVTGDIRSSTAFVVSGYGSVGYTSGKGLSMATGGATNLDFSTVGTSRMTIDTAGNVGIGVTNPTANLEVSKSQNATTQVVASNTNTGATAKVQYVVTSDAGSLQFGINSVANGGGTAYIWNSANSPLVLATNGAEQVRVTNSGKVGIGNTSPTTKLDVKGGTIRSVASTGASATNSTSSVDWSLSNNQTMTAACTSSSFTNMEDGATYNLAVMDTTATQCVFSQSGLTFYFAPANGSRIAGLPTLYSFTRIGTNVFVSWTVMNP